MLNMVSIKNIISRAVSNMITTVTSMFKLVILKYKKAIPLSPAEIIRDQTGTDLLKKSSNASGVHIKFIIKKIQNLSSVSIQNVLPI